MKPMFKGEEDVFRNAKNFREFLAEALENKIKKPSKTDWNNPGWPFARAHMDGYNYAIQEIIEMLKD